MHWSNGHHGVYHFYDDTVERRDWGWRATIITYNTFAKSNILVPGNDGLPNLLLYSIKGVHKSLEEAKDHVEKYVVSVGWNTEAHTRNWLKWYQYQPWRDQLFEKYRHLNYHYLHGWDWLKSEKAHYAYTC